MVAIFIFYMVYLSLIIFCDAGGGVVLSQEAMAEARDLSPVLFEDSPSPSSCLLGSEGVTAAADADADGFRIFGKSVEEAVSEMRFRIEQRTMLTASAGDGKTTLLIQTNK